MQLPLEIREQIYEKLIVDEPYNLNARGAVSPDEAKVPHISRDHDRNKVKFDLKMMDVSRKVRYEYLAVVVRTWWFSVYIGNKGHHYTDYPRRLDEDHIAQQIMLGDVGAVRKWHVYLDPREDLDNSIRNFINMIGPVSTDVVFKLHDGDEIRNQLFWTILEQ